MESPASKEEIKQAFEKADSTGDGKLTFAQIKEILAAFAPEGENKGPEFDRLADMVCHMADLNGDKMIDFGEIIMFFFGDPTSEKNQARTMFRMADTNGDGYVNKKELKEFLKMAGGDGDAPPDSEIRMMVAMFDNDDDGKLNYEEFNNMMEGNLQI